MPLVLVSVAFGLYHYTHIEPFHAMVVGLMGKMFLILLFFLLTRNVYLTLGFHSCFVAFDFTDGAKKEIRRFKAKEGYEIVAKTVSEILAEELEAGLE